MIAPIRCRKKTTRNHSTFSPVGMLLVSTSINIQIQKMLVSSPMTRMMINVAPPAMAKPFPPADDCCARTRKSDILASPRTQDYVVRIEGNCDAAVTRVLQNVAHLRHMHLFIGEPTSRQRSVAVDRRRYCSPVES